MGRRDAGEGKVKGYMTGRRWKGVRRNEGKDKGWDGKKRCW